MLFVNEEQLANYQNDTATYSIQEVKFGRRKEYFVTSKNSTNNLPITTTSVEGGPPCIHPGELSNKSPYYPLEKDRLVRFCTFDDTLDTSIDTRYKDTGGRTNEYDLQWSSGTLAFLSKLPLYDKYVPGWEVNKKEN